MEFAHSALWRESENGSNAPFNIDLTMVPQSKGMSTNREAGWYNAKLQKIMV